MSLTEAMRQVGSHRQMAAPALLCGRQRCSRPCCACPDNRYGEVRLSRIQATEPQCPPAVQCIGNSQQSLLSFIALLEQGLWVESPFHKEPMQPVMGGNRRLTPQHCSNWLDSRPNTPCEGGCGALRQLVPELAQRLNPRPHRSRRRTDPNHEESPRYRRAVAPTRGAAHPRFSGCAKQQRATVGKTSGMRPSGPGLIFLHLIGGIANQV